MHFAIQKEVLVKALKDVNSAVANRVVQPILSNILIESTDEATLRFVGTDLDLAIETKGPAVVYKTGSITLPGKKLLEIVSKLPNDLVTFQTDSETWETSIDCKRSKFTISGLSPEDFPELTDSSKEEGIRMPADVLRRAVAHTSFAAASYDTSNVLGGVYLSISDGKFEATATDGSRLANRLEELSVAVPAGVTASGDKELEGEAATATLEKPRELTAIVPARACTELLKILDSKESGEVRLAVTDGQITFRTENHYLTSRLIGGEYPRYQELFPSEVKYEARISREEMMEAIDRVAVMSDDRTHLMKLHFEGDNLKVSSNTPDVGRAHEELPMKFEGQVLDVALNVRYVLDVLQRLDCEDVLLEMTGPLKPLIFKLDEDDKYRYLLMPVQAK